MAIKIYTKTGDDGTTSLIGGTKVPKSHLRIEAYGTVDELNSYIGLCRDLLTDDQGKNTLLEVQDRLFTIGSSLACDPIKEPKMRIPDLKETDVELLEKEIAALELKKINFEKFYFTWRAYCSFSIAYCPLCLPQGRTLQCKTGTGKS